MAFHSQTTAFNSQVLERKAEWVKWNRQPIQGAKVVLEPAGSCQRTGSCGCQLQLAFTSPGADDSELFHAELESGAVHSQTRRCTPRSGEDPLGLFQGGENVPTFGLFQSSIIHAILSRAGADIEVLKRDL